MRRRRTYTKLKLARQPQPKPASPHSPHCELTINISLTPCDLHQHMRWWDPHRADSQNGEHWLLRYHLAPPSRSANIRHGPESVEHSAKFV